MIEKEGKTESYKGVELVDELPVDKQFFQE